MPTKQRTPFVVVCISASLALLCFSLLSVQQRRARLLQPGEPPIQYLSADGAQHVPQGMHVLYVPATSVAAKTQQHVPAGMHVEYVPATSVAAKTQQQQQQNMRSPVSSLARQPCQSPHEKCWTDANGEPYDMTAEPAEGADEADLSLGGSDVNEADEAFAIAHPFDGERSCGIQSLVDQAHAIFPRWDACGYMMGNKHFSYGYISAPEDDTSCTLKKMEKPPCNRLTLRKLKEGSLTGLRQCLSSIKGLSQTCDTFDKCGPIASSGPFVGRRSSVCFAPEGDYYREASVQRMCGICSMFHAQDGDFAATREDTRVASTWLGSLLKTVENGVGVLF